LLFSYLYVYNYFFNWSAKVVMFFVISKYRLVYSFYLKTKLNRINSQNDVDELDISSIIH